MNQLERFAEIARKWRCGSRFRDDLNPKGHDYAATYLRLLRDRPVRKILEIGLGPAGLFHAEQVAGAGVRMWSELFPGADIYGLDIREDTLVNEGRIRSFLCDQSNERQLSAVAAWIGDGLDLVIDDGSHVLDHQLLTARIFLPMLSEAGVYVVEDVLPESVELAFASREGFTRSIVELNVPEVVDDRLVVIERSFVRA